MREILFRGKRKNTGKWIFGDLIVTIHEHFISSNLINVIRDTVLVDSDTVGQFTGLLDKNGEMIFEGDICRFREWCDGDMCWIGAVYYDHCTFVISGGPNTECDTPFHLVMSRFIPENIEVIGNIHDNPELIKD